MSYTINLLHISDLHAKDFWDWRRDRVLGEAWLKNLQELLNEVGSIDLVCFTGDFANYGRGSEYEAATPFLLKTLETLEVDLNRFFSVPGNHDIDRKVNTDEWKQLCDDADKVNPQNFSNWIAGSDPPFGLDGNLLGQVLMRQGAYRRWITETLGRAELNPTCSMHGTLGYAVKAPLKLPFSVHIIGIDTAWLSGDRNDASHLRVTDHQLCNLATNNGKNLEGLRICLHHHPFDDLHPTDRSRCRQLLPNYVDYVLRGHLHMPSEVKPDDVILDAGCLFEGSREDSYPNSYQVIILDLDGNGTVQRTKVLFRKWSENGFWANDDHRSEQSKNGWVTIRGGADPCGRAAQLFVGRETELKLMKERLTPITTQPNDRVAVCSLQGGPGVGKSYLADRFYYQNAVYFHNGYFRLELTPTLEETLELEALVKNLLRQLDLQKTDEPDWVRVNRALRKALVHIENADSEEAAAFASKIVDRLVGCTVIVSGRFQGLGTGAGWQVVKVEALDPDEAYNLFIREYKGQPKDAEEEETFRALVTDDLGGLPLAIHLASGYLRQGMTASGFLTYLREQKLATKTVDPAEYGKEDEQRLILSTTFEISLDLLERRVGRKKRRAFEALGHAPSSGFEISLGAAIAGLNRKEFDDLTFNTRRLSLLEPVVKRPRTWRLHPLIAEHVRHKVRERYIINRLTKWFLERLSRQEHYEEISQETPSLFYWLQRLPQASQLEVLRKGEEYARANGPYHAWARLCEACLRQELEPTVRSYVLWVLTDMYKSAGDFDKAIAAAKEQCAVDLERGEEREAAIAAGQIADIHIQRGKYQDAYRICTEQIQVYQRFGDQYSLAVAKGRLAKIHFLRGDLQEALRIRRDEELPVYKKMKEDTAYIVTQGEIADIYFRLGKFNQVVHIRRDKELPFYRKISDLRSVVVTKGKIADVHHRLAEINNSREEYNKELRIRQEDELPFYTRAGDLRLCAVTKGHIADIHYRLGEIDEAMRLYKEILPVFDMQGDVRERATTIGKIAEILHEGGDSREALRMYREEVLPDIERLELLGELAIGQWRIARYLMSLQPDTNRDEARQLLCSAIIVAEEIGIPLVERMRSTLDGYGMRCDR